MSRRAATVLVAVALVIVAVAVARLLRHRPAGRAAPAPTAEAAPGAPSPAAPPSAWPVTLWLPSESQRLEPEATTIESAAAPQARAAALVAALLAARPEAPRAPVFPRPVALGRLLVIDGTAYVDLRPEDGGEPPSAGSALELMRVYAVVHTLVRNVPEVARVVLLWNGVQRHGFPGHVDTGRPLVPLAGIEAG